MKNGLEYFLGKKKEEVGQKERIFFIIELKKKRRCFIITPTGALQPSMGEIL